MKDYQAKYHDLVSRLNTAYNNAIGAFHRHKYFSEDPLPAAQQNPYFGKVMTKLAGEGLPFETAHKILHEEYYRKLSKIRAMNDKFRDIMAPTDEQLRIMYSNARENYSQDPVYQAESEVAPQATTVVKKKILERKLLGSDYWNLRFEDDSRERWQRSNTLEVAGITVKIEKLPKPDEAGRQINLDLIFEEDLSGRHLAVDSFQKLLRTQAGIKK